MEGAIQIHIAKLPEGVYLAISDDISHGIHNYLLTFDVSNVMQT